MAIGVWTLISSIEGRRMQLALQDPGGSPHAARSHFTLQRHNLNFAHGIRFRTPERCRMASSTVLNTCRKPQMLPAPPKRHAVSVSGPALDDYNFATEAHVDVAGTRREAANLDGCLWPLRRKKFKKLLGHQRPRFENNNSPAPEHPCTRAPTTTTGSFTSRET